MDDLFDSAHAIKEDDDVISMIESLKEIREAFKINKRRSLSSLKNSDEQMQPTTADANKEEEVWETN